MKKKEHENYERTHLRHRNHLRHLHQTNIKTIIGEDDFLS